MTHKNLDVPQVTNSIADAVSTIKLLNPFLAQVFANKPFHRRSALTLLVEMHAGKDTEELSLTIYDYGMSAIEGC